MSLQCDCGSYAFHIHSRNHVMCERCAEDFFLDREFEVRTVSDERDTGTFLDEVSTDAYMGKARNDDGRLVSVLRWHFEGDDIERNKHALIQREMAAYAIKRELKNVRDLLLEVADQPDVETYKEHVRGALDERIKELEAADRHES